jgi:hypothetical protein
MIVTAGDGLLVTLRGLIVEQHLVLRGAGRFHPGSPFVVALAPNVQDPAGHRDVESVVGEFTDQREDYFVWSFSRA